MAEFNAKKLWETDTVGEGAHARRDERVRPLPSLPTPYLLSIPPPLHLYLPIPSLRPSLSHDLAAKCEKISFHWLRKFQLILPTWYRGQLQGAGRAGGGLARGPR